MAYNYISGRGNLSCTIFVPFDCSNNCPFCTSKAMYKDLKPNLKNIINIIKLLNFNTVIKEYVFTGGEPFSNLNDLNILLNECQKPVYINTTLPTNTESSIDDIIDFINNHEHINGINISRHIGFNFNRIASIDDINRIKKPIRINTVINKNFNLNKFLEFVTVFGGDNRLINLRADYRNITNETLKCRDSIDNFLLENFNYHHSNSCMVCNSEFFYSDDWKYTIMYHRGLQFSSFVVGNKKFVNDVIVTPDAKIYGDWDLTEDKDFNMWLFLNKKYV